MGSSLEGAVVSWGDLPPELISIIAGKIPTDIILVRSVCRSWRSSLPPFPNGHILSPPLFPHPISFPGDHRGPRHVTPYAVYLLRDRQDPSNVWVLSVQESSPGKLRPLQFALNCEDTLVGSSGNALDLSEWIVTQITSFYTFEGNPYRQRKVVFPDPSSTATAVCGHPKPRHDDRGYPKFHNSLWAFETTETEEGGSSSVVHPRLLPPFGSRGEIQDFVSFNGRIYLAEAQLCQNDLAVLLYCVLRFDYKTCELVDVADQGLRSFLKMATLDILRFVVSDGDLYLAMIATYYVDHEVDPVDETRVYKLVRDADAVEDSSTKWERVSELGDRVFFITEQCSFSVPARYLPPPWNGHGDCLVFSLYLESGSPEILSETLKRCIWKIGVIDHTTHQQMSREGLADIFSPGGRFRPSTTTASLQPTQTNYHLPISRWLDRYDR